MGASASALRRCMVTVALLSAVAVFWIYLDPPVHGQSARSYSLPGQEHLTFWAHHNGLEQVEVEGEVGFGDMARLLLRRRSNSEILQRLRDRFTFRRQDLRELQTPDLFLVEITDEETAWKNRPERFTLAAGRTFNVPLIVVNGGAQQSDALFYVDWIDKLIARVEQRGRFATEAKKQEVVDLFRKAREIYARIASQ